MLSVLCLLSNGDLNRKIAQNLMFPNALRRCSTADSLLLKENSRAGEEVKLAYKLVQEAISPYSTKATEYRFFFFLKPIKLAFLATDLHFMQLLYEFIQFALLHSALLISS